MSSSDSEALNHIVGDNPSSTTSLEMTFDPNSQSKQEDGSDSNSTENDDDDDGVVSPLCQDPKYLEFSSLLVEMPARFSSDEQHRTLNGFRPVTTALSDLPSTTDVIKSRLHSVSYGIISSIPSAIILFLSALLYLNTLNIMGNETQTKTSTTPRIIPSIPAPWRAEILPIILPGNVSLVIMMSIGNFWGFGIQSFKTIAFGKWRLTYYVTFCIIFWGTTALMVTKTITGTTATVLLPMYILAYAANLIWYRTIKPVFVEYATGKTGSKKKGNVFPWFITMGMAQAFGMTFVLGIYQIVLVNTFFSISDPLTQFLIRFFLHPILYEFVVAIYRVYALYLNYCFHKAGVHLYHWYIFCVPAQFIFSLYGRIMVATLPSIELQILTAILLAAQDQMLRTFMQNRDNFFISLLQFCTCSLGKSGTLLSELRKSEHGAFNNFSYASMYSTDEISEVSGIFLSPIIIAAFKLGTKTQGPPPASTLIITALVSLFFEVGTDIFRAMYYLKTTSYLKNSLANTPSASYSSITNTENMPFAAKIHFFWRNVEYSIHEAFVHRMPHYGLMLTWYHVAAIFFLLQGFFTANFCGSWNGKEVTHTFYCSS